MGCGSSRARALFRQGCNTQRRCIPLPQLAHSLPPTPWDPPGLAEYSGVPYSGPTWASKSFPAGHWIVTRKGGFAFSCPRGRPPSLHCCQAAGSPPLSRSPRQASAPHHHPGCLPGSGVGVITSLYSQTCPQESSQSSGSKCNETLGNHPFRWGLD